MSSWLSSSLSTGLQSTIGQIRTITKEIVEDIRNPLEDNEVEELNLKVKSLEEECSKLKYQANANLLFDANAVLKQLVDEVGLSFEVSSLNDSGRTSALADYIRSSLIDVNSRLTNLVDLDYNISHRICTLYEQNCINDPSWTDIKNDIKRFPLYFALFGLLERCMRERSELKEQLAKTHSQIENLSREVNRLKSHLLDIHEQQDEEIQKRVTYCDQLESELHSITKQQLEARKQIEKLTDEKNTLLDELRICIRDAGKREQELIDKVNQQTQLCTNLHNALTNSHNETKQMLSSLRESHVAEIEALNKQLQTENRKSEPASEIEKKRHDESELKRTIKRLKMDLALKEEERRALAQTLRNISPSIGNRIEKSIARELLISFLRTDPLQRLAALRPLARVLEFTEDQVEELTALNKETQGWFSGWTARRPAKKAEETMSLAELLIKYVDQETRPELRVRFNTDSERHPTEATDLHQ